MAIRVKKLAKELRARPAVVLLALSDLGYTKYKSPMDMVSDVACDKVRKLARTSGLPSLPTPSKPAVAKPQRPAPRPARRPAAPTPPSAPPGGPVIDPLDIPIQALAQAAMPAIDSPDLSRISSEIQAEERRLQSRSQEIAHRSRALEASYQELDAQRAQVEAERDRLEREKARLLEEVDDLREQLEERARALDAIEAGGVPVSRLLEERGLRGADEQGRALGVLAKARMLDKLLPRLRATDPGPVRRLLRERLVLGGPGTPELPGVAVVQVASDRSEIPSKDQVDRLRQELAGEFLLAGLTRARLVGGGKMPLVLRMVSGDLDPRIRLQVVPATRREADQVAADVADVEVLILWGVAESDEARAAYAAQPVPVVRVPGQGGLSGLLAGVREGLLDT